VIELTHFQTTMKPLPRRSRRKQRPVEVSVDFLVPPNASVGTSAVEAVFLSKDLEKEFEGLRYVAVGSTSVRQEGWTVFKVEKWDEHAGGIQERHVVISGVNEDLRSRFAGRVLVQGVTPAPLDTVIFKLYEHDYDALAEDTTSFQRLKDEGTVLRAGKAITTVDSIPIEVTLCEPILQGVLGEETEIVLFTGDEYKETTVNGLGTPFSTTSQNDSQPDLDILQFLSLPSSEDDVNGELAEGETFELLPPQDEPSSRGIPLRVLVLERPVDPFSLDPRPSSSEDDEFRVYAHMRDIARIGVFSGDWVFPLLVRTNGRSLYDNQRQTPNRTVLFGCTPPPCPSKDNFSFHRPYMPISTNRCPLLLTQPHHQPFP
jgi:hypothetical protein